MKMPTKKQILEASKDCPDAREVLRRLFPEAFEEEWEEITDKIKLNVQVNEATGFSFLHITYEKENIGMIRQDKLSLYGDKIDYKTECDTDAMRIFKKT